MFDLKKIVKTLGTGAVLLAMLASCGGPKLIGLIPVYNGETPTTTTHEFKAEDFLVIATYDDGTDKELAAGEFKFEVTDMEDGIYVINITYKGMENECYVPMDLSIYPSDNNG